MSVFRRNSWWYYRFETFEISDFIHAANLPMSYLHDVPHVLGTQQDQHISKLYFYWLDQVISTVSYLKCFRHLVQLLPWWKQRTQQQTHSLSNIVYIYIYTPHIDHQSNHLPPQHCFLQKKKSGKKRGFWSLGYDHQVWRYTFEPCNVTCSPLCNSLLRPFFSMWMDNWGDLMASSEDLAPVKVYTYIYILKHIDI